MIILNPIGRLTKMIQDMPNLIKTITTEIKQSMDAAVIGMSGGADSTLVAVLCFLALGKENVYSIHMPATAGDEETFNRTSQLAAEKLGIHKMIVPVGAVAEAIIGACTHALGIRELSKVNTGNTRARARMTVLYGVAHHLADSLNKRVRVVGTGNLSEDFIGYDTKGGDALADIFPIGDLFKSEVYQLLDHFCKEGLITEAMIDRTPSAGLWLGQTDEEELGYSYNAMEASIRKCLKGELELASSKGIDHFVLQRHIQHKHKHEAPPVVRVRSFCD